jgi:hypothetical protein
LKVYFSQLFPGCFCIRTLDRDKVITYKDGIISVEDYNQELDWIIDIVNEIPFDKIAEKQDDSKEDKK